MQDLHDLVAVREESCFTLPKETDSVCHWKEGLLWKGKRPGPQGYGRCRKEPDFREGEAGGDAQVRRPACHVCHEATRNWLARNACGTRAFDSADLHGLSVLPRGILLKRKVGSLPFLFWYANSCTAQEFFCAVKC